MQRRTSLQISHTIILLGILTILIQFIAYYFLEASYIVWAISCIISLLSCHILLQQSATYEACYCFSLLTLFISLAVTVVAYFGDIKTFLPYTDIMLGIVVINWLVPVFHCTLRYIIDYGIRVEDFLIFYRNTSIIFIVFYIGILIYSSFFQNVFEWAYPITKTSYNILPFEIIAALIEDYLYGLSSISDITSYLLSRILIFAPYGFYVRLILFKKSRIQRTIVIILLPLIIEFLQYIIIPSRCDIDDILYSIIGCLIGSFAFFLFNCIVRAISGRDFLVKGNDYFSRSSIHF